MSFVKRFCYAWREAKKNKPYLFSIKAEIQGHDGKIQLGFAESDNAISAMERFGVHAGAVVVSVVVEPVGYTTDTKCSCVCIAPKR